MQEKAPRRNEDRSRDMRAALITVGRKLFSEQGFAGVGTPELVAAAGVSRGALYHHFADKEALFAAVVEAESAAVAEGIRAASSDGPAIEALIAGGEAYLAAMQAPGRVRLLLIEAPAVLGPQAMADMDARQGGQTLREGLAAAMAAGELRDLPVAEMADLLSAAFERAALSLSLGGSRAEWQRALRHVITGLAR